MALSCPLNTKELCFPLPHVIGNGVCVLQVYSSMPLHVQKEILVRKLRLCGAFDHVEVDYACIERSFDLILVRITQRGVHRDHGLTLKCIRRCSAPVPSLLIFELSSASATASKLQSAIHTLWALPSAIYSKLAPHMLRFSCRSLKVLYTENPSLLGPPLD